MKSKNKIYLLMLVLLALHFFVLSCGTKTKSSNETEVKEKTLSEAEIMQKTKQLDSIKVALEEEFRRKYNDTNSTETKTEATRTTTTEITETIQPANPSLKNPADYRELRNGNFINDAKGEIITRTTKQVIEERFNEEMLRQQEIKIEEEEKKKKDSIATFEKINEIIDKKIELKDKKDIQRINNLKKEGWKPSLWQIIGFTLFIIVLLISLFSYFKYSNPFSWIFAIFKRFKNKQDGSAA